MIVVDCDVNSEDELNKFLAKFSDGDNQICFRISSKLVSLGLLDGFSPIRMIKKRNHQVFLDMSLQTFLYSFDEVINYAVWASVDIISCPDLGDEVMMKKLVTLVDEMVLKKSLYYANLLNYEKDYQNGLISLSDYEAKKAKVSTLKTRMQFYKPILLGTNYLVSLDEFNEQIINNHLSMTEKRDLAKKYLENGFGGMICDPSDILSLRIMMGESFSLMTSDIKYDDKTSFDSSCISPELAYDLGYDGIILKYLEKRKYPSDILRKVREKFVRNGEDYSDEFYQYISSMASDILENRHKLEKV